jgi:hypothetical protein
VLLSAVAGAQTRNATLIMAGGHGHAHGEEPKGLFNNVTIRGRRNVCVCVCDGDGVFVSELMRKMMLMMMMWLLSSDKMCMCVVLSSAPVAAHTRWLTHCVQLVAAVVTGYYCIYKLATWKKN